jgi:hypothetical protein
MRSSSRAVGLLTVCCAVLVGWAEGHNCTALTAATAAYVQWVLDVESFDAAAASPFTETLRQSYATAREVQLTPDLVVGLLSANDTERQRASCMRTFGAPVHRGLRAAVLFFQSLAGSRDAPAPSSSAAARSETDNLRVVVVGGGPVGLMSAVTAALAGAHTTLIEKRRQHERNTWFDLLPNTFDGSPSLDTLQHWGVFNLEVPLQVRRLTCSRKTTLN